MGYRTFVTVGDSCAEGLDDPYPDRSQYRGWADFVANRLAEDDPGFRYANLAVRGRRLDQITAEQLPAAQRHEPDLIALFGGGNDVMTRGWDARTVARRVDAAIRRCTQIAPAVVTFTLSDIAHRMPFGRRMRPRITALNDAIREASVSYGATLVDLWPDQAAHDSRYFGADRLHLSQAGHLRVAGHVLDRLGVPHDEGWLRPLPGLPSRSSRLADLQWVWQEVLPVGVTRLRNQLTGRSPGDGFLPKRPDLLPVVFSEAQV
ncbi:SGNH/GDSL hydrolase family protein [Amycolatopsis jiangsuensis]|uniref:Lysophospholipase L1-like esterase n=1 Tax=Amycolatopsis jiangsuensis TaxID=1181879 RepID=A0A840J2G5_9PSEU|nr:SGNH/GDSL hydrolase family protein [Amycolatopsis jiangsuensis]MBB4688240.1 lysophospholipase L1-like esterase [Amycolatopsis jiangsuensis]